MKSNQAFIEKVSDEEGFAAHFAQYIEPKLLPFEGARQSALKTYKMRVRAFTLGGIGALAISIYVVNALELSWFGVILLTFALWPIYKFWVAGPLERYQVDRKGAILPAVLRFVGNFRYDADGTVSDDLLRSSHLFEEWNKNEGQDLIAGAYYDHAFQFCVIELSNTGSENTTLVFKGFVIVLQTEEPAEYFLTLAVKDADESRVGGLKRISFQHQELDPRFEEKFEVYTTDETEARRLVSPSLSREILKVERPNYVQSVEFAVTKGVFLLKVETNHKFFEPFDVKGSALTSGDSRRFLNELHEVLGMVEALALSSGSRTEPSKETEE